LTCPSWCAAPDGHGWEHYGRDWSVHDVAIGLVAEGAHAAPLVWVSPDGGGSFSGPQARQLAAALLNAADEWDQVAGAAS
jgi:hypothetical protein